MHQREPHTPAPGPSQPSVLDVLRAASDKGSLLEEVLRDILTDLDFRAIRRQASGSQFGYDLAALKPVEGKFEIWLFECKNLDGRITLHDLAPKLVWHFHNMTVHHFVIVSPSELSNDAEHLLSNHAFPMPISAWTGTTLEALILGSPRATARLGLTPATGTATASPHVFPPRDPASFHVVHQARRSVADYMLVDGQLVKADDYLDLSGIISNRADHSLLVHRLLAISRDYRPVPRRILRQITTRAIRTPEKLEFTLAPYPGSTTEILLAQVWEVPERTSDALALRLVGEPAPGFYVVGFEAEGVLAGRSVTLTSPSFHYHQPAPNSDILQVWVDCGFSETPCRRLLEAPEAEWAALKQEALSGLWLGPTMTQRFSGNYDSTWLLRVTRPVGEHSPDTPRATSEKPLQETYVGGQWIAAREEVLVDLGISFGPMDSDKSRRSQIQRQRSPES